MQLLLPARLQRCILYFSRSLKKENSERNFCFTRPKKMEDRFQCMIAVTQMTCTEDKEANWHQLETLVSEAAQKGVQVVFLPEGCDYIASSKEKSLTLAEDITGPFVWKLRELARQKQVYLSAGGIHIMSCRPDDARISNTHLMITSKGEVTGRYSKTHLFSNSIPGVSINEGAYVRPGEELVPPVPTPAGNVGLAICYDLRFPIVGLTLQRQGAHILTYPSAFTVATGTAHWHTLLRSRAIENQCYVVAAAQAGQHNAKRSSYGHAMVVDPWGKVLSEIPEGVGLSVAEVSLEHLFRVRREMPCAEHARQDLCSVSLLPNHKHPWWHGNAEPCFGMESTPTDPSSCPSGKPLSNVMGITLLSLLQLERLPPSTSRLMFGSTSVPGDAVFFSTALAHAFTNLYPREPGHCLVAPCRAVLRLVELSCGEVAAIAQLTVLVHRLLCDRFGQESCEVAVQDGPRAGQTIHHVHVHVLPSAPTVSLQPPDVQVHVLPSAPTLSASTGPLQHELPFASTGPLQHELPSASTGHLQHELPSASTGPLQHELPSASTGPMQHELPSASTGPLQHELPSASTGPLQHELPSACTGPLQHELPSAFTGPLQTPDAHVLTSASTLSLEPFTACRQRPPSYSAWASAMVAAARDLRKHVTSSSLNGDAEPTQHVPLMFQPLPLEERAPDCCGAAVPDGVMCLRSRHTLAYCVRGDWQKCHIVVQMSRQVSTLGQLRPSEAYELFTAVQLLIKVLCRSNPGVDTTVVFRPRNQQFESVHAHVLPWLNIAASSSDMVYEFVSHYERDFGEEEQRTIAAALRKVVYCGEGAKALRELLLLIKPMSDESDGGGSGGCHNDDDDSD